MTESELSVSVLLDPVVIPKPPVSPRQEFEYASASPLSLVTVDTSSAGENEAGYSGAGASVSPTAGDGVFSSFSSLVFTKESARKIDAIETLEAGRTRDVERSASASAGGVYIVSGPLGRRASSDDDDIYGSPPELPPILQQINDFYLQSSMKDTGFVEDLSPKTRERLNSQFLRTGMDPREVPFWPTPKSNSERVDFSKPEQDWDLVLLLRQVVEHKRSYPLDSVTFREYLVRFHSEENIDFLLELNQVRRKAEESGEVCKSDLIALYEKFIKPSHSEKPVNISWAALRHLEIQIAEDKVEIRDFNLANRDICELIIRGPYLRDFFKENLKNDNANELRIDKINLIVTLIGAIASYVLVIFHSYFWLIAGLFFVWCFFFTFQKTTLHVCPVLALWMGGVRLRPSGQFWHCLYMNEHLQKIHDHDLLEAQKRSARSQLLVSTIVSIVLSLLFALLRFAFL